MRTFQECMLEYNQPMRIGAIPQAYQGLMAFLLSLRNRFKQEHPELAAPGTFYQGVMDMSYFPLQSETLKGLGLKIAVVYLHEAGRFEAWLAAGNKQIQEHYWQLFTEQPQQNYRLVPSIKGYDSILESVLVEMPDFSDLGALGDQVISGTLAFARDVEVLLVERCA